MARIKALIWGLVTVAAIAIGIATLFLWQEPLSTVQAAQDDSTYVVQKGDSLYSIANKLDVNLAALAAANGLPINATLNREQQLLVPATEQAVAAAEPVAEQDASAASTDEPSEEILVEATVEAIEEATEESTVEATQEAWSETTAEPTEEMMADVAAAPAQVQTYIVQSGDTLFNIANKLDVSIGALAAANGLKPNSILMRGQVLTIPGSAPAAEAPAALPAPPIAPPAEATPEPSEEMMEEATPEATEEPTAEEPTAEEPTAEATEEPTVEPTEEATPEPTEEMMEEATPEATEEAAEEPTAEATEEAMAEATPEMTESEEITGTEEMTSTEEITGTEEMTSTEEMTDTEDITDTEEMTSTEDITSTEEMTSTEAMTGTEEITGAEEMTDTEEMMEEATPEATAEPTEEATEEATPEPTEEMTDQTDILDMLVAMGSFNTLLETLDAAGLSETLQTEGPFTLFAPTDDAFDALPEGTVEGLLASSPDDLSQILLFHLLQGEIYSADLVDGATIITAQGGTVTISVTDEGILINDALITINDIATSNGVIHVIDTVLLPSENTAAVPIGTAAQQALEAASDDAGSGIIVPVSITDTAAAAQLWAEPAGNIDLFSPVATGGYHSPIEIIGLSQTFEGVVAIVLSTADGTLLAQRMTLGGDKTHAFFQTDVRFFVTEATEATLSVLEIDMAEGSILNQVDTPITLLPGQRFIDVNSPVVGQAVCDPILVSGYSSTFEANVVLTLSEPDGNVLLQTPTMGGSMGIYRDFATSISHTVSEATPLLLSLAETDASGVLNTIDETVIPITLYPAYSAACY